MSFVLAIGLSAMAGGKEPQMSVMKLEPVAPHFKYAVSAGEISAHGLNRKVSNVSDLYGPYQFAGFNLVSQSSYSAAVVLDAGREEASISISSFPWAGQATNATVNMSENTITIQNNQLVGQNGTGGDDVYLYCYELSEDEEGNLVRQPVDCIIGEIGDDGSIIFPTNSAFGASDPSSEPEGRYFYLWMQCSLSPIEYNTPKEDDYYLLGMGEFQDIWFPFFTNDDDETCCGEPQTVEIYKHKTENKIAVKNPYGASYWTESGLFKEVRGIGWFVFNIITDTRDENEDEKMYAAMDLLVPSVTGVEIDPENGNMVENTYFCFNGDGYYYAQGEDMFFAFIDQALMWGLNVTDVVDGQINLKNPWFGVNDAPDGLYWWDNAAVLPGYIKLPEGWSDVKDIVPVAEKMPVKYYNLQGQELKEPAKGEIIIKVDAGKMSKIIVR